MILLESNLFDTNSQGNESINLLPRQGSNLRQTDYGLLGHFQLDRASSALEGPVLILF